MRRLIGPAMAGIIFASCSGVATVPGVPVACAQTFSEDRCAAMTDRVAEQLDIDVDRIEGLEVLPDPTPRIENGQVILEVRSGGPPVPLLVHLADGTTRTTEIGCPGISASSDPACMDDPRLRVSSVTFGGYRDVPCVGEDPPVCATAHPTIDPEAAAETTEVRRDRMDIPIDRIGPVEIPVGQGSLPNGILTEASFEYVDDWPPGVHIAGSYVLLDVRSLEPDGKPFDNYYLHGWREGVERVEAVLVFEVSRFEPGAVLSVEDVVVR